MIICIDVDNMLTAFPEFFAEFVPAMRDKGSNVGVLSARSESEREQIASYIQGLGIELDFLILKPDELNVSDGIFKATVCNDLCVDVLFDDFECSDPKMVADFFSTNNKTIPFTSWAYKVQ